MHESGAYSMRSWQASFATVFLPCGIHYITDSSTHTFTRTVTLFGHDASPLDSFTWTFKSTVAESADAGGGIITTTIMSPTVITSSDLVVLQTRSSDDVMYAMGIGVVSPVSLARIFSFRRVMMR